MKTENFEAIKHSCPSARHEKSCNRGCDCVKTFPVDNEKYFDVKREHPKRPVTSPMSFDKALRGASSNC